MTISLAMLVATVTGAGQEVVMEKSKSIVEVDKQVVEEITETTATTVETETVKKTLTTRDYVNEYFKDTPILIDVAHCESGTRQHDEYGNVLRGRVNAQDVGVMQINEKYHKETAVKLGLNIYTLEGNLAYGKYLYETQGTAPWEYSSKCWGKTREVALVN